ncbi:hypothetical protein CB7_123 [Pectobacterium phage vB_PatM_CB7]|nr:hypothetical protein CB7_123 [Pectobacterium phage vB_PatM_CB7]
MSSFDAIFLHGVMDYTRGSKPSPSIPDFKDLQKRLSDAQRCSDDSDLISDLSNIASDFDFDNEIEQYVDKSYEVIDHLHRGIRDACSNLVQNWDPDNMTRDEMVAFVESLHNGLEECLPESVGMKSVAMSWFGYEVATFIQAHHALNHVLLSYHTTDDQYHSLLRDDKLGTLNVKAGQNGVLTLEAQWKPGRLIFTSDKKIVLSDGSPTGRVFSMPITEFSKHFEYWATPTDEEISFFDVLHPGADWTVLRYLRDYIAKNYISSKKPISLQVSVTTTL